jgi:hypothetical protein
MEWQSCRAYLNDLVAIWLWYTSISLGSTQHAAARPPGAGLATATGGAVGRWRLLLSYLSAAPPTINNARRASRVDQRGIQRGDRITCFFLLLLKIRLILVRTMERTESFGHYTHG